MPIETYISTIILNVSGLNAPTKRHRLAESIHTHTHTHTQDPYICCLQETYFRSRDINIMKVKGWKMILCSNGNQKKAGVATLISDKIH